MAGAFPSTAYLGGALGSHRKPRKSMYSVEVRFHVNAFNYFDALEKVKEFLPPSNEDIVYAKEVFGSAESSEMVKKKEVEKVK